MDDSVLRQRCGVLWLDTTVLKAANKAVDEPVHDEVGERVQVTNRFLEIASASFLGWVSAHTRVYTDERGSNFRAWVLRLGRLSS
ncbi:MAG: hypothetical protein KF718_02500 [Polyangiaceae bacterium]|nr:hypothetical protein [Polyangiaceae bacterium]